MRLSANFTLAELTVSQTAARHGFDNAPPPEVIVNLKRLAVTLQQVRSLLENKPILVSSGYRSKKVNTLVGGSSNSDHMRGLAADFISPSYGTPDEIIRAIVASDIPYKQVIREFDRWVHLSIPEKGEASRRQALIIDRSGPRAFV